MMVQKSIYETAILLDCIDTGEHLHGNRFKLNNKE